LNLNSSEMMIFLHTYRYNVFSFQIVLIEDIIIEIFVV
jgi:hypothetical protein